MCSGQRVLNSPRLSVYTLNASGPAGSASLPDIRFSTDSYWVTDASLGFKANVASRLLVNFNMRFNLGDQGWPIACLLCLGSNGHFDG